MDIEKLGFDLVDDSEFQVARVTRTRKSKYEEYLNAAHQALINKLEKTGKRSSLVVRLGDDDDDPKNRSKVRAALRGLVITRKLPLQVKQAKMTNKAGEAEEVTVLKLTENLEPFAPKKREPKAVVEGASEPKKRAKQAAPVA